MNQATVTADVLGTGLGHRSITPTGLRGKVTMAIAAALAGAVLALGANAVITAYQAGVAARPGAAQLELQHGSSSAASAAERSIVQHLLNERAESPSWTLNVNGVPSLVQSAPPEAASWGLPQDAIPVFMQTTLFGNPDTDEAPTNH